MIERTSSWPFPIQCAKLYSNFDIQARGRKTFRRFEESHWSKFWKKLCLVWPNPQGEIVLCLNKRKISIKLSFIPLCISGQMLFVRTNTFCCTFTRAAGTLFNLSLFTQFRPKFKITLLYLTHGSLSLVLYLSHSLYPCLPRPQLLKVMFVTIN